MLPFTFYRTIHLDCPVFIWRHTVKEEKRKSRLPFQVNGLTFGGAFSTALEPNTSSREMVLESSVKLKLSTTRSSKT